MMLSPRLVCTLVVCVTIGSVVKALPTPQFRFGMPAHFSFRTVHTPFLLGQPSQAPNTFFFRQPRLTSMAAKAFSNLEVTQAQQPQSSPAFNEETHVPVFVPVQNDFQGDSVVVSSDDLVNIGLTGALENTDGTVDPAPVAMDEGTPVEDLSVAPEADIQTKSQDAVLFEESAVGPLSIADDSFVLTASEAQPEPVDLVSPVDSIIETEVIPQEVQPAEPVILQPFDTTSTVSPFQTETFKAYNQFMNTWIQLASNNLNRPELLKLVNFQPIPQTLIEEQPEPRVLEIQESVVPESQPEVVEPVEAVQTVETSQSTTAETVEEIPVVEEALPIETVTEGIVYDFTPSDVTTELPLAEVVTEVTGAYVAEEVTPVAETIPEVNEQDIATNTILDNSVQLSANIPAHFNTIPTYTSRGRLSGFRYSFAHVPQRGTFFLNSFTG